MSRALTSVEVEDVLSSIRRLVSEELRVPAGNGQLVHPGVLLLRPEQRVDLAAVQANPAGATSIQSQAFRANPAQDGGSDPASRGPDRLVESALARDDAALTTALRGLFSQGGEGRGTAGSPWASSASLPGQEGTANRELSPINQLSEAAASEPMVPEAAIWIEGEDEDLEPLEFATFISFPSVQGKEVAAPAQPAGVTREADLDKPLAEVFATDRTAMAAAMGEVADPLLLQDPINAPVQPQPDLDAAQSPHAASDIAAPAGAAAGLTDAESAADLQPAILDENAMVGLDEAQLRVLVRGMVRSELQGDLGVRMSRNIRKVLRTEIAKALSLHGIS